MQPRKKQGTLVSNEVLTLSEMDHLQSLRLSQVNNLSNADQELFRRHLPSHVTSRSDPVLRQKAIHVIKLKRAFSDSHSCASAAQGTDCSETVSDLVAQSTADPAVLEKGIKKTFSSEDEAIRYAKYSSERFVQHEYTRYATEYFTCANDECLSYRRMRQRDTLWTVEGLADHNHSDPAKAKRRRLTAAELRTIDSLPEGCSPAQKQSLMASLNLTLDQWRYHSYYRAKKMQKTNDWQEWIASANNTAEPDGARVVGWKFQGDHRAVLLSANAMLDSYFSPNVCAPGYICLDGTRGHLKGNGFTFLRLGVQDVAHHYRDVAFAITTSAEAEAETYMVADTLERVLESRSRILGVQFQPIDKVMTDGAIGFHKASEKLGKANDRAMRVAMCTFHVLKAIRLRFCFVAEPIWTH